MLSGDPMLSAPPLFLPIPPRNNNPARKKTLKSSPGSVKGGNRQLDFCTPKNGDPECALIKEPDLNIPLLLWIVWGSVHTKCPSLGCEDSFGLSQEGRRMPLVSGLVPSRFLVLTAHLVIVITIFWSRENNVRASLPLQCTPEEYNRQDTEMVVALSVTLGLFVVELAGFLSGVSMFNNVQSLLSTLAHASAGVALLFFLFEQWDSSLYWWIFAFCSASVCLSFFVFERWETVTYWYILGFCSALPAVVEIFLFISVFGLKKKPL